MEGKGISVDISKRPSQEGLALQHGRSVMKFKDSMDDEVEQQDMMLKVTPLRYVESGVDKVPSMLESMNEGEIGISTYNMAWVTLAEDIDEREQPQFPAAIEWIAEKQLEDAFWGDNVFFSCSDRILCTLARVIALTSPKIHSDKCEKGIAFLKENILKLEDEDEAHMPSGFENTLQAIMEIARDVEIEIPFDHPVL